MARQFKKTHPSVTVTEVCNLFGISKATFFYAKNPTQTYLLKHNYIKKILVKILRANPHYGARRIKQELNNRYHINLSRKKISKLLFLFKLQLPNKSKQKQTNIFLKYLDSIEGRYNLLLSANINKCCYAIATDITSVKTRAGTIYIAMYQELYTRKILGWAVKTRMTKELVLAAWKPVQRWLFKLKKQKLLTWQVIVHQDRGSQYTSYKYINTLLATGLVKLSYSGKGKPYHNPYMESLYSRLKDELEPLLVESTSLSEAQNLVRHWVLYYNNKRMHSGISYRTPNQALNVALKSLISV